MKKVNIFYWIFTGLFGLLMFFSAIPDVMSSPVAIEGMHNGLGYPVYFVPFIGVAKMLGVVAILVPGFPKIKEWAYAGLFFDLIGATYSIIAVGNISGVSFMILPIALGIASYAIYTRRRSLQQQQVEITNRTTAAFANAA